MSGSVQLSRAALMGQEIPYGAGGLKSAVGSPREHMRLRELGCQ